MIYEQEQVAKWLISAYERFESMHDAEIDLNGLPAIKKAMRQLKDSGTITVGQAQYIFNRSHPKGALPKYNHHRGLHRKHGEILRCPVKELVDSDLVDWSTGKNGVLQPDFANVIKDETSWEWSRGTLRRQTSKSMFTDMFA